MIIHVVQQEDTIVSIAEKYGVTVERLILDNGLDPSVELVNGQTIVIAYPTKTYTVQEGDSLLSIANTNGISLLQLLRNNPYLCDREYIYPGETLVIRYDNIKGKITTNGYANAFIDEATLKRTLPYLSYLSVFGYRITEDGEILGIEDTDIIRIAKEYKVAPLMILSSLTFQGIGNPELSFRLLYSDILIEKHIENMLLILKRKGYYGINLIFQFINEDNRQVYENYTRKVTTRLKLEGFKVFITISENYIINADRIEFEKIDFTNIGQMIEGITILNYNWGFSFGPPAPVASVLLMRKFCNYIIKLIPPEKIEIGMPIIGYDWELPYTIGITKANSLTLESAIALAGEVGAVIQFDEDSQTPYFRYVDKKSGASLRHIVWFIDARSINAIVQLAVEYGFRGTGIWNIMNYYPQMWLVINTQYEIETLLS
jgi:spore germination protein